MMRHIDTSCPYCGAPVIMDKKGVGLCEYCGQYVMWDDGSQKVVLEDAYNSGYEFEKGRQQAQAELQDTYARTQYAEAPRRRHWFWWVMGWIFIYPIPLMILMIRNRAMNPWARALISIAGWASYFLIAALAGKSG